MTEHRHPHRPTHRPHAQPPVRGSEHYRNLRREITARPNKTNLFTITIKAASAEGGHMDEQQFLIDMIFKPDEPGLKLRPEETQLLLAYIGEILKEIEEEEKLIVEEEASKPTKDGEFA